jgi:cobalt-zinc-cadmium resistance protein CzcA
VPKYRLVIHESSQRGVHRSIPGAADVKAEQTQGLPMLRVKIDRQAIARYGIHASDVLDVVGFQLGGRPGSSDLQEFGISIVLPR